MRPTGTFDRNYYQAKAVVRTNLQWGLLIAFIAFLYVIPVFADPRLLNFVIAVGCYLIAMLGLQILTGYAGQISIGHAAFMCVGAYTSCTLTLSAGVSFWLAVPLAGLLAAAIGVVFGAPSARLKGFYLAFATLAAHFVIIYAINSAEFFGGTMGIGAPRPELFGIDFGADRNYCWVVITAAVIMTFVAKNLVRSKAGRAFVAIRDNDLAAEVMGINVTSYKIIAFGIGCFFAGVGGALWAHYCTYVNTEFFSITESVWFLGFLILGGMGSIVGAIFGVVTWKALDEFVTWVAPFLEELPFTGGTGEIWASVGILVFALVIIVFLVLEPRGLVHRWEIIKASYRLHPFAY